MNTAQLATILTLFGVSAASAACDGPDFQCSQREAAQVADMTLRQGNVAWAVVWREQSAQMKVLGDLVKAGKLQVQDALAYQNSVLGDTNRRIDACPNPRSAGPFC
ncbi:hypothetical protein [Bradyrhizobium japonicum]|uniref:hypothetical protein n=1 Tax=Bradyrhizobium japonicum TaxID=375 RepID=UPI00200E88CF|nr:hypothetical protein [Bradyrhizobium japonicum]UQD96114.1 hypothetical protein JEY30_31725 [Bradyrhizobium japonicum]